MIASILDRHHVTVRGRGTHTMILAHGFGTTQYAWYAQIAAFQDTYRLILFDLAGASEADPLAFDAARHATLDGYVTDLLEIMEALNLHDTIYVGHSMSGMIGLLAARQCPERFRCLICIGASPRYLNDAGYVGGFTQADLDALYQAMATDYGSWVTGFAPLVMGNVDRPTLAMAFGRSLSALVPSIARSVARVIFQSDYRAALPSITTTTLLIQAHDDIAVPLEVGQYLARTLPHATLWLIEAHGHLPHMSAPSAVNAAICSYLAVLDLHQHPDEQADVRPTE
jgi:sigma-B regulation protein RsbQ